MKKVIFVLFVLSMCGCETAHVTVQPPAKQNLAAPRSTAVLKAEADAVLNQSNVSARREISVVFELVDRLLEENQLAPAETYLIHGLEHYPWNLKYQMIYAKLLADQNRFPEAIEKAGLVWKYAEEDELIGQAERLLGCPPVPEIQQIEIAPEQAPSVVLIPMQGCSIRLMLRIQKELSAALGIPVYLRNVELLIPHFFRNCFLPLFFLTRRTLREIK